MLWYYTPQYRIKCPLCYVPFLLQTTRLAVMKANISQQGLNIADLLDPTATTPMMTPIFNATAESSAYYNVTEPILFIINATTENYPLEITTERYYSTTTESTTTTTKSPEQSCFQIMVDCATLTTTTSTAESTTKAATTAVASEEIIYDEEDYDARLKRHAGPAKTMPHIQPSNAMTHIQPAKKKPQNSVRLLDSRLRHLLPDETLADATAFRNWPPTRDPPEDVTTAEENDGNKYKHKRQIEPARTTPQSIGRLLESLNSILRNLKGGNTTRIPAATTATLMLSTTTTTEPTTSSESVASTPESLEDLIRWHTAGLQLQTTAEEDYDNNDVSSLGSSSSILFDIDAFNQTDSPPAEASTDIPESTPAVVMCPLVVCPWNDTTGYFSSLTTNIPLEEDSTSLCRGDNPQGCTPFWTSARDDETITSFHSSSVRYTTGTHPVFSHFENLKDTQNCIKRMKR